MFQHIARAGTIAILSLVITACGAIAGDGGSTQPTPVADQQSAAAYLPTVSGYTVTNADSISDAITNVAGEGADIFGNAAISAAIDQADAFIQCYQDVGAVAANIYTQADLNSAVSGGTLPGAGAIAVVNQDRIRENLINCVIRRRGSDSESFSAQSVSPCQGSGSFNQGGDTFTYIYFGTNQSFCDQTTAHFGQYTN